ncbi:serine protease, partial [Kibdelosporangium lantanae]
AYQQGVVPPTLSTVLPDGSVSSKTMRVIPDVAADGDMMTGMLVGQTVRFPDGTDRYTETRWGGTSLSTPLFVGMQALAQQAAHRVFGFANPLLYERSGTFAFDDVVDGTVPRGVVRNDYTNSHDPGTPVITRAFTVGRDGPLHATPGYDNVTGLGVPSAKYVLSYLD